MEMTALTRCNHEVPFNLVTIMKCCNGSCVNGSRDYRMHLNKSLDTKGIAVFPKPNCNEIMCKSLQSQKLLSLGLFKIKIINYSCCYVNWKNYRK